MRCGRGCGAFTHELPDACALHYMPEEAGGRWPRGSREEPESQARPPTGATNAERLALQAHGETKPRLMGEVELPTLSTPWTQAMDTACLLRRVIY
jgi:hypothetical protein